MYVIEWRGETFDPATLTIPELEVLEDVAGHGYGSVDPRARAGDFAALLTVFLMRTHDGPEVLEQIATATLGDLGAALKPRAKD